MKRNREIDKLRLKSAFGDDLFVRYLLGKNENENMLELEIQDNSKSNHIEM